MPKRGDWECASDIAEAIGRIKSYTRPLTYPQFLADRKTQDAIVRNLEIIGEAAKNLSTEFKKKHRDIDWRKIAGMRDKLVHEYFGVNWDIVWEVAKRNLPKLERQIRQILHEPKQGGG